MSKYAVKTVMTMYNLTIPECFAKNSNSGHFIRHTLLVYIIVWSVSAE